MPTLIGRIFGEPLHTLRKVREHVASWYVAVVALDVPDDNAPGYLTCLGTPTCCAGTMSGLLQPLPGRMVSAIEYVGGRLVARVMRCMVVLPAPLQAVGKGWLR
jgi:hypothetical protein